MNARTERRGSSVSTLGVAPYRPWSDSKYANRAEVQRPRIAHAARSAAYEALGNRKCSRGPAEDRRLSSQYRSAVRSHMAQMVSLRR